MPEASYSTTIQALKPGDVLALYTDGLIERRTDSDVDVGLGRLQVRLAAMDVDRLVEECAAIVDDVADPDRPDDVALVLARYDGI